MTDTTSPSTPDNRRHDAAQVHYEAQLTEAKRQRHYELMLAVARIAKGPLDEP